jgi:hypothetical protein
MNERHRVNDVSASNNSSSLCCHGMFPQGGVVNLITNTALHRTAPLIRVSFFLIIPLFTLTPHTFYLSLSVFFSHFSTSSSFIHLQFSYSVFLSYSLSRVFLPPFLLLSFRRDFLQSVQLNIGTGRWIIHLHRNPYRWSTSEFIRHYRL